ncbi:MAG: adenosylcobinamide-phosphate synthase CbiB [Hylemonella sp.]|uniref:adenosylcobinamide-phosphate synthase CbiB n=1 Tax=Hylemonella sp. TaxID=2066020 RepID=UPI0022C35CDB|nr:adenosylcobinamide-phosphate synthase CbiB [Hylemonella sp.]MCZ8251330.1 adenosylcobinamide-phosphate synthase CbiB [Hylemonella sp.]
MDFWPVTSTLGPSLAGALWLALLVDRSLGEPPARWHPVVWMGHYLGWMGQRIAPQRTQAGEGADITRFVRGALAWSLGAIVITMLAWWLQRWLLSWHAVVAMVLLGLLLKPLLAWRMLRDEVQAVETALQTSLESGRAQLARLVSRDVSTLDAHQVRESAIESLAENLNDSLVAPLFWFALLGLPGAALYRYANTADAMWGYRGLREGRDWTWAGKWAARADDVLSWIPARLTALLLALVRGGLSWRILRAQAPRTPSPNSGWPMAAMALALDVRLGKPGVYVLHESGRAPQAGDTLRAVQLGERVVLLLALLLGAALLFVGENRA